MNLLFVLYLISNAIAYMFFPPICIGQVRRCDGGNCWCEPTQPRDLSQFDLLNKIGYSLGHRNLELSPPSFAGYNQMYQASQAAKMWEYDWNKQYALRY